jgi:hypothetical protein
VDVVLSSVQPVAHQRCTDVPSRPGRKLFSSKSSRRKLRSSRGASWRRSTIVQRIHETVHKATHRSEGNLCALKDTANSLAIEVQDFNLEQRAWSLAIFYLNPPSRLKVGVGKNPRIQVRHKGTECIRKGIVKGPHGSGVFSRQKHNPFS